MKPLSVWLAVLTVLFMSTGCAHVYRPDSLPGTPTSTPMPPARNCLIGESDQGQGCKPCPELKPCFYSANEMHFVAEAIAPAIARYYASAYSGSVPPPRWFVIPSGSAVLSGCGLLGAFRSLEYCAADDRIFLGEDALWRLYNLSDHGDAIIAAVMSHESAHHAQSALGMVSESASTTQQMDIQLENQADCMSGAIAKYMRGNGYFGNDDLNDVVRFMPTTGQNHGYRTHGTAQQRSDAFKAGYVDGARACDNIGFAKISPN